MGSARLALSLAAAMTLAGTVARAADYPPPPPPIYVPPPVVEKFSGWYLRGDIGFSNQKVDNLSNLLYEGNTVTQVGLGFDAAPIFGLGVGYYFNDWLRFDVTGEYRGRANFHGIDIIVNQDYTNEYRASKSEWLFLANLYADLGTWHSLTPFVGAGIGASRNTIHSFLDVNTPNNGVAFGDEVSKWNLAWALHAGIAYKVNQHFTVEFSYRYLDLGDAESGDIITYQGTNNFNNPMEFNGLTSHDVRVGLRFNLDGFDFKSRYHYPPPVYHQPPPVYHQPPPVYHQPPPVYTVPPRYTPQVQSLY